MKKTNVMKILDKEKINYETIIFEFENGYIGNGYIAKELEEPFDMVYKTLVTIGSSNNIYMFLIPVLKKLDLKKCAKICNEKKITLLKKEIIKEFTGYERGGCSPIGMENGKGIFIENDALKLDEIILSGGAVGVQVKLKLDDLKKIVDFKFEDIAK